MKIAKSILGIIGFMLFLMGVIYGDFAGAYLSTAAIFIMLYAFNVVKMIERKSHIKLNLPSNLLLLGSLIFIYLSFYETNITIYNVIMATCCTILLWLFIFYLNIPTEILNIEQNIQKIKSKYNNYKMPPLKLLNQKPVTYNNENNRKEIDTFLKDFKIKAKFVKEIQNSWLYTYKYEIATGTKIDSILELQQDLELKLQTKTEIDISNTEKNIINIKVSRNKASNYTLGNTLPFRKDQLIVPLGEDDEGNKREINIEQSSPILLLGEVETGKTNLLNVIINTMILNYTPQQLNLILIDKHQTGLDCYQNLPQLVLPLLNNPNRVTEYLDSISKEIERRLQTTEKHTPIVIIIDEVFDINGNIEEIKEKLEQIILLGKKVGIYLIVSTSIMNKTPLMDYLDQKIDTKIYFYGRNKEEYNPYQNTITSLNGIINYTIERQNIRIRTPKITDKEIDDIVKNAKGLQ